MLYPDEKINLNEEEQIQLKNFEQAVDWFLEHRYIANACSKVILAIVPVPPCEAGEPPVVFTMRVGLAAVSKYRAAGWDANLVWTERGLTFVVGL